MLKHIIYYYNYNYLFMQISSTSLNDNYSAKNYEYDPIIKDYIEDMDGLKSDCRIKENIMYSTSVQQFQAPPQYGIYFSWNKQAWVWLSAC